VYGQAPMLRAAFDRRGGQGTGAIEHYPHDSAHAECQLTVQFKH